VRRSPGDRLLRLGTGGAVLLLLSALTTLVMVLVVWGAPALGWNFLAGRPTSDLGSGGIFPAIYGTVLVTLLMTLAGVPVGVATALYLAEYAPRRSRWASAVRAAVQSLAGVPSIVYGLFGLGFFVLFVGGGVDRAIGTAEPSFGRPSVLWAGLTLAVLTLPVVIVTAEEAFRTVSAATREAAYAAGATRVQTTFRVVLPEALGGVLTGVILAVGRGAGEVAPILLTGVVAYQRTLPTDVRDGFMHLGHHVYVLATQAPDIDASRPRLAATALVLLALTFVLNFCALWLRARQRRRVT